MPVLLRAVRRPAAVRALERNGLRLVPVVRVHPMAVLARADGAGRELLDRLAARADGGEGRLGERVEEVVLRQDGLLGLWL